jgi:hypothetical protein
LNKNLAKAGSSFSSIGCDDIAITSNVWLTGLL